MLVAIIILLVGHVIIWLLDGRLRRNLIIRLREKSRLFELQHSAQMHRHDGLFIKIDLKAKKAGGPMVASTKKVFKEGD